MQTIVIIGASNVTLSLPVIWSTLRRSLCDPFRLVVAAGHGRSFGMPNTVLGRTLPGILECGLWEALDKLDKLDKLDDSTSIHTIVTDIGNDLLYGLNAAQTMSWVNETVERLSDRSQKILITGLPIDSLNSLSKQRFDFFRSQTRCFGHDYNTRPVQIRKYVNLCVHRLPRSVSDKEQGSSYDKQSLSQGKSNDCV